MVFYIKLLIFKIFVVSLKEKFMPNVLCKNNENIFYLRFVKPGQNFKSTSIFDLNEKNVIDTSWLNIDYYNGFLDNEHHITFDSFYNVIIPFIKLYINDFKFEIDDFEKIKNVAEKNGRVYDFSYLKPKKDMLFTMDKNSKQLFENKPFKYLNYYSGEFDNELDEFGTEYHKAFRGYHSCCRIVNNTITEGKTIFITGDSMTIPLIPILCCYFKEVVYMDNRDLKSHKEYYEGKIFDNTIVQLWEGHPINKPLGINLM